MARVGVHLLLNYRTDKKRVSPDPLHGGRRRGGDKMTIYGYKAADKIREKLLERAGAFVYESQALWLIIISWARMGATRSLCGKNI